MPQPELGNVIVTRILSRFSSDEAKRNEALRDVLLLQAETINRDQAERMAVTIPELPEQLYKKWAELFAQRLLETVPVVQIEDLCQADESSSASLGLVFLMFMESERMERQIAHDLKEFSTTGRVVSFTVPATLEI